MEFILLNDFILDSRSIQIPYHAVLQQKNLLGNSFRLSLVAIFYFPIYKGNFIIPIEVHIFQRGGPTTNQHYGFHMVPQCFIYFFRIVSQSRAQTFRHITVSNWFTFMYKHPIVFLKSSTNRSATRMVTGSMHHYRS